MRKKLFPLLLAASLLLTACGGNVSHVKKSIGESEIYTRQEFESAMNVAISYFAKELDGCTLNNIVYNEEFRPGAAEEWAQQYDSDQAILLISSFEVGASGGDGSLNPNSTYNNWQWILVRDSGGNWELKTWGYG